MSSVPPFFSFVRGSSTRRRESFWRAKVVPLSFGSRAWQDPAPGCPCYARRRDEKSLHARPRGQGRRPVALGLNLLVRFRQPHCNAILSATPPLFKFDAIAQWFP